MTHFNGAAAKQPELCKKAESLAAQGLTMDQIAQTLGMGRTTLYEKVKEYPYFSDAIEQGRSKGIAQVTNALFKKATDGDVSAQKYYLNNRDNKNWKDRIDNTIAATIETKRLDELSDEQLLEIARSGK